MKWLDRLAHDLRGPLAPLQTAAYLLKSGQLEPERQAELFDLLERQTRRMGRMIDEVGDWARASQGRLLGSMGEHDLEALLEMTLAGIPGAPRTASNVAGCDAQTCVQGDQRRLVQLLRILVEHAMTRAGTPPRIELSCVEDQLRIDVTDDGPALEQAQREALLEEPLPEPGDEGLGLRLLLARAIAEAHGGRLDALPAEGAGGLCMRCQLPLA